MWRAAACAGDGWLSAGVPPELSRDRNRFLPSNGPGPSVPGGWNLQAVCGEGAKEPAQSTIDVLFGELLSALLRVSQLAYRPMGEMGFARCW